MKAPMRIKDRSGWHGEVIFAIGRVERCHFDPQQVLSRTCLPQLPPNTPDFSCNPCSVEGTSKPGDRSTPPVITREKIRACLRAALLCTFVEPHANWRV